MFPWIPLQLVQSYKALLQWTKAQILDGWPPRYCSGWVRKIPDLPRLDENMKLMIPRGSNKLKTRMMYNGQDMIWLPGELWRTGTCTKLGIDMLVSSILSEFADYTKGFVFMHSLFFPNPIIPMMRWCLFLNQWARIYRWINWDCEAWRSYPWII